MTKRDLKLINGRLARRICVYVILVSTVITLFTASIQIYTEFQRELSAVDAGFEQIEHTQLTNIVSRVWVLDINELQTTLDGLLTLPYVHYIAVYENEEELLSVGNNSDDSVVTRSYPLVYHFNDKDHLIGKVVVNASLDEVYQRVIDRIIVILVSNAIKTFIVAGFILLIFYQLVARHLNKMADFAQQLNINTLDKYFEFERKKNNPNEPDELDLLSDALAKMQQNLTVASLNLQEQQEQTRRAQKMDALGKLTSGIAHDYNNILGVIVGYADILRKKLAEQLKLADYAEQIHHAGLRGAKLTKTLLTFSRQGIAEASKLNMNEVLRQQHDMLQKTLTVRVKLVMTLQDDLWPVWLDCGELEDTVLNMSINAMHAMSENDASAQLSISTSNQRIGEQEALALGLDAGEYVQLSLADTGHGMDTTTKEKMFDPFFTTKGNEGTGLGLSQVFGFIKRSNGTVKVQSEPGKGCHLILYFPHFSEEVTPSAESPSIDTSAFKGTETILVVDDEAALQEVCIELLSEQGYRLLSAANAEQALQVLAHNSVDLMLSDIIMPQMDGYQLSAIVQERYPAVKIQLVSGLCNTDKKIAASPTLKQNLLNKPYEPTLLLKTVRQLLDE